MRAGGAPGTLRYIGRDVIFAIVRSFQLRNIPCPAFTSIMPRPPR
ncbi:hypothetical protein SUS17_1020 [Sphingomonas sp. S17]|nr:hypothetical protein SUS17_1020 [Sphingomonas sp. S17]